MLYQLLFFGLIFVSTFSYGTDQELLQTSDVNKIMKQIFDQHVDKKEITASIIKSSFKVYIDQFDPSRIYLLESEVHPFLQISDSEIARIMDQYKKQQFSEYLDLNTVIQKAIVRAQKARQTLLNQNTFQLFAKSDSSFADGYEDWSDPDLRRTFASQESELNQRNQQALIRFIAVERRRYGDELIKTRLLQVIKLFEKDARAHENQYLFLTDQGQPMSEAEKQNAFTMHVLKSLANSLDAHTTILSSAEASNMRVRLEKEEHGIGIDLKSIEGGRVIVTGIVEGGPAAQSKLIYVKDEILEIDNVAVQNKSANEVMNLIRGKNDSKIHLLLRRSVEENGEVKVKDFNVSLVRGDIAVDEDRVLSDYEKFDNGIIGKIKLDSFYQNDNDVTSENDVRNAINKLRKEGNLRGLIIDLRENSGGFLSQAVKVAGLFITDGVVVISKYFNGEERFYRDMDGKRLYDGPLILLTSKATASAAEIVAQALQDYGVALIVGDEHTYGKGSIQSQTVTENQGTTFFKVTVGKYYTVSGKTPQIQGVKADVVVPSQFVHENIGEEYLDHALKSDVIPDAYKDTLSDISPDLKPWYIRYYMPQIQQREVLWEKVLPDLRKQSAYRIAHNEDFQRFLRGTTEKRMENSKRKDGDLQMEEAVNILKDMIIIESKVRMEGHHQPTNQGKIPVDETPIQQPFFKKNAA